MGSFFDKNYVIAEIAQAHDGSLGYAHAYIDAVAKTGADAIKFQTHYASEESTYEEPWRVKFSYQDEKRYDYWKRMEFSEDQWIGLKNHAEEKGLLFISSPFSVKAAEMLNKIGMQVWKLSSGEISNKWLLDYIVSTDKPMIISTGMSSYSEIDWFVDYLKQKKAEFALLQCTSKYPVLPEEIGLNVLNEYKSRYDLPVGLSDHSGTIFPSIAATALGAKIVEVHVCLSKDDFGPDVSSSITIDDLENLVKGTRMISSIMESPVDKDLMAENLSKTNLIFSKSVCTNRNLKKGTVICKDMINLKKPGKGVLAKDADSIIGKILLVDKQKDEFIAYNELGE